MSSLQRVMFVVADSLGVGHAPDADRFASEGAHTAKSVLDAGAASGLSYPTLESWGLRHAACLDGPDGGTGRAWALYETSAACDTPTGHWELFGRRSDVAPPTFPTGFSPAFLERLARAGGVDGFLANEVINGVKVIELYGEEHLASGKPIIYTSADSVVQIAAHEESFSLERLYELCIALRHELDSDATVAEYGRLGRVIARPFVGTVGNFIRTGNRRDWAVPPPDPTALDLLANAGIPSIGIGKIGDIFTHRGLASEVHPDGDAACLDATVDAFDALDRPGMVIVNLVEFDTKYGHMRDPLGYAEHLAWLDARLVELATHLVTGDRIVVTADHGNDPNWVGTDHTRERVPALVWGPDLASGRFDPAPMASLGAGICAGFGIGHSALDASPIDLL